MSQSETSPLKSVEDVLIWQPISLKCKVESIRKCVRTKDAAKTLLCHDMMGGYLDDRFHDGVTKSDCYRFFHWSNIDIFVYFSHYLVTIPPVCWINAAHINGCLVLGTFITESNEGESICQEFLKSTSSVEAIVSKLVDIAIHNGFDGWLLNIENKIQEDCVGYLRDFAHNLTERMHKALPNSKVIWYDSVIENGELKWQNALNEKNRIFFDACDSIFLNYTWKDDHLDKSLQEAGSRVKDVFVGVDVFGRGCLGDGGFCTNIAVKKARSYGFSVAIFAPGWVYETLPKEDFTQNEYKFWDLLSDLCPFHGPAELPLVTSFCQGFGYKLFRKGKMVNQNSWTNLSHQHIQPTFHYRKAGSTENTLAIHTDTAYSGGGCLKLSCQQKSENQLQIFKLFMCELAIQGPTAITYAVQPLFSESSDLTLLFEMVDESQKHKLVLLSNEQSRSEEGQPKHKVKRMNHKNAFDELKILKMFQSDQENVSYSRDKVETLPLVTTQKRMEILEKIEKLENQLTNKRLMNKEHNLDEIGTSDMENHWITRVFLMDHNYKNWSIVKINALVSYQCKEAKDTSNILLGQLQIIPLEEEKK